MSNYFSRSTIKSTGYGIHPSYDRGSGLIGESSCLISSLRLYFCMFLAWIYYKKAVHADFQLDTTEV